ncbi:pectin lyase-like protein [Mollisia scopiformis]|uniref:Pectin lyase-like protein n=1 Tax=Mollisia scopiformis TaxID=149040 RepID=A0A132BD72_MOLSC|nr:pectin lyase-like protein [Mollisia scopiformis]KUJ09607.1 pectin lyase-like protein [Mollisia scopiformis]
MGSRHVINSLSSNMSRFRQITQFSLIALASFANARGTPVRRNPDHGVAKRAVCTPTSAGDAGTDDVPAIESAIASCGNGGTIVIPAETTYALRSTLSFAGCANCDFQIEGTLKASDDLTYWEGKKAIFLMSDITSAKVHSVTGTGLVDGNGQAAYDYFAQNSSYARPTLWYITGSNSITISNLEFRNAPNVFHSAAGNSKNIAYSDITLIAESSSFNVPKNTDGWDIGPATYVTITNADVSNQDDCVAFKPGASYVSVSGITCTGSHGLSVGSLGESGTTFVENIYVYNATMISSTKAVGIKLYPGGYGTATVSNVTWDTVTVTDCAYAAQIQSCYGQTAAYCAENPGSGTITDVYFKNFKGTTSTSYEPVVANLDCPADGICDIYLSGWDVAPPSGTAEYLCANIDSSPGITCTSGASR